MTPRKCSIIESTAILDFVPGLVFSKSADSKDTDTLTNTDEH